MQQSKSLFLIFDILPSTKGTVIGLKLHMGLWKTVPDQIERVKLQLGLRRTEYVMHLERGKNVLLNTVLL